jgi:hypothetical protein
MKTDKIKSEIETLNYILQDISDLNHVLFEFAESAETKELRQLTYSSVIALGRIIETNADFLIKFLESTVLKEEKNEEFNKLMAQLEDINPDGKAKDNNA